MNTNICPECKHPITDHGVFGCNDCNACPKRFSDLQVEQLKQWVFSLRQELEDILCDYDDGDPINVRSARKVLEETK